MASGGGAVAIMVDLLGDLARRGVLFGMLLEGRDLTYHCLLLAAANRSAVAGIFCSSAAECQDGGCVQLCCEFVC